MSASHLSGAKMGLNQIKPQQNYNTKKPTQKLKTCREKTKCNISSKAWYKHFYTIRLGSRLGPYSFQDAHGATV